MRVRKQDSSGDMMFGQSQNDYYVNQKEGVGQLVETRLRLWYGEWSGDTTDGVPYVQDVLDKSSPDLYNGVIKDRVLSTPGVSEITEYSAVLDRTTRKITITMSITTIYGTSTVQTIL